MFIPKVSNNDEKSLVHAHLLVLKQFKDFESTRICQSECHFQKNATESYKNDLTTAIKYCHAPINQTVNLS